MYNPSAISTTAGPKKLGQLVYLQSSLNCCADF